MNRSPLAVLGVAAVVAGVLSVSSPAIASVGSTAKPSPSQPAPNSTAARMGDYSPSRFTADAMALPADLSNALERDLNVTAEEYLAAAAAAVDASRVLDGLKASGIAVYSSHLAGTTLVVEVNSAEDAQVVEGRGAEAEVIDPGNVTPAPGGRSVAALENVVNGTGWGFQDGSSGYLCSIGFNGYNIPDGAKQFVTAGHCLRAVTPAPSPLPPAFKLTQTAPNTGTAWGTTIGPMLDSSFEFGGGYDSGIVSVTNTVLAPEPQVSTWGGGAGDPTAGTPVPVYGQTTAVQGSPVCRSGRTSGWRCGTITATNLTDSVSGQSVTAFETSACALPGDSGGSAMVGNFAVGVLSGGNFNSCSNTGPQYVSVMFPMTGGSKNIATQHPDWELQVALSTPTASIASAVLYQGSPLTGTLPNGVVGDSIYVYIDGATTPTASVAIAAGSTSWSVALPGVAVGNHTFRVVAGYGTWNRSTAVTGSFAVALHTAVDRIAGSDRYDTAVKISQAGFPATANIVFIATGAGFADALSAAPVAAKLGGPLLLTPAGSLPSSVKSEIQRLAPQKIVIVGGPAAVSTSVETALEALAPNVQRFGGADRYAVARAVDAAFFGTGGIPTLYIATGTNFPDALSAAAAAGAHSSAVLIVPGAASQLDAATMSLITSLHPAAIRIAGGTAAVSAGIAAQLNGGAATVARVDGTDRYNTSEAVNKDAFASAPHIYVASGVAFPDALAGAVLASRQAGPLYVNPTACMAPGIINESARLNANAITILGGLSAQSAEVEALRPCS
jgi:putative cell wall-binding protein